MSIFANYPLIAALLSIVVAQLIKVPLYYATNRSWNLGLIFSTGGMPSSHSAAVASLSTAIGISYGVSSAAFAVSVVISMIVMFDAAGIRRHAGEQAVILNRLAEEFHDLFREMKSLPKRTEPEQRKMLKELLGHRPSEVLVGGLLGGVISYLMKLWFY